MQLEKLQVSEKINQLIDFWESKKQGDGFPLRKDISPSEIPHLLPYIILTEYNVDNDDFLVRIVGEHIVQHTRNIQGLYVKDIVSQVPDLSGIYHLCRQIVEKRVMLQGEFEFISSKQIKKEMQYVGLPISVEKTDQVDMILCMVLFQNS